MRKVIVNEFMSLDEVAQAPGAADEDPSGSSSCYIWKRWRYATTLDSRSPAAARQLASRGRRRVRGAAPTRTRISHAPRARRTAVTGPHATAAR
jgi:hypothetical protein